ncbi:MAG TPA: zf-HC2 domain-containing protein [Steroidobacter sp.]|uniref:zf-HC2 domain-containing protein n=1 Tax=Steroidobacter sp. TaxID=1978227 RepID=UPI002ED8DD89
MHRLHSNHEQCWELIPWVVNGRASDVDQREVLAHAENCSECRDELERHRALYNQMRGTDDVIAAPNASWQKLLAQLDQQPAAEKPARIKRPWLVAAIWIQLIAIAALTGALFRSAAPPQPEYTTLASPQASDRQAAVRVVFAPNAQLQNINQMLRAVECDIVAGPSEAGVYTLATREGQDVRRIMATLREHSEVLFAEPSQMSAGTTR